MTSMGGDRADFEEWLGQQFTRTLGSERGTRPRPAEARYAGASLTKGRSFAAIRSSTLATLSAKAMAAGVAAALAAGSAVAATAATGTVNPVNWGQHVVQAVEHCRTVVPAGGDAGAGDAPSGIGQCVSAAARQHGQEQHAMHATGAAEHPSAAPRPSALPGKRLGQVKNGSSSGNGSASSARSAAHGQGHKSEPGSATNTDGSGHGQGQPTP
jgi:hypothetical protein